MLLNDIERCAVVEETEGGESLVFAIDGYCRPPYVGQHPYPTEGSVIDEDGEKLSVVLYADQQDRLLEMELIRWSGDARCSPRWDTFELNF